ncbi:MAG: hypothetical protein ACK4S4_00420 [Pyrinomonadaceae bacterium]
MRRQILLSTVLAVSAASLAVACSGSNGTTNTTKPNVNSTPAATTTVPAASPATTATPSAAVSPAASASPVNKSAQPAAPATPEKERGDSKGMEKKTATPTPEKK